MARRRAKGRVAPGQELRQQASVLQRRIARTVPGRHSSRWAARARAPCAQRSTARPGRSRSATRSRAGFPRPSTCLAGLRRSGGVWVAKNTAVAQGCRSRSPFRMAIIPHGTCSPAAHAQLPQHGQLLFTVHPCMELRARSPAYASPRCRAPGRRRRPPRQSAGGVTPTSLPPPLLHRALSLQSFAGFQGRAR